MLRSESFVSQHGDAIWGTIIGALLAFAISWFFYRRALQPKTLDLLLLGDVQLLNRTPSGASDLKVTFQGDEVFRPRVVEVALANTGRLAILKTDFEQAVTLTFADSVVLTVETTSETIKRLDQLGSVSIDGNVVEIVPRLLNRGESLKLSIVLDGPGGWPQVDARVIGTDRPIKSIEPGEALIAIEAGTSLFANPFSVVVALPALAATATFRKFGMRKSK